MKEFVNSKFDIPVLFLVFNRLNTTKQVFEVIRKTAPAKLYISSDGPREHLSDEKEKVDTVRKYVLESVDWDCEVKTLFHEKNLGCGKAPSEAITWLFQNEEMGIILEDDCLPSISFFAYCKELLEKYRYNEYIYHIAGHNPLTEIKTPYSYYFARIQHCWGWATWRRAWNHYNYKIINLDSFIAQKKINKIFFRTVDRKYWLDIFKMMEKHEENDIWDYQWTYSIFNINGICINPSKNLITNIGFGADATHTKEIDPVLFDQISFEITNIIHPNKITLSRKTIIKINEVHFKITRVKFNFNKYKVKLKKILKLIMLYK